MKTLNLDELESVSGGLRVTGATPFQQRFGDEDFGFGRDGSLLVTANMRPAALDNLADELREMRAQQPTANPYGAPTILQRGGLPATTGIPGLPGLPGLPNLLGLPTSGIPGLPRLPGIPGLPNVPGLPTAAPGGGASGNPLGALGDLLGGKGPLGNLGGLLGGGGNKGGGVPAAPGLPNVPGLPLGNILQGNGGSPYSTAPIPPAPPAAPPSPLPTLPTPTIAEPAPYMPPQPPAPAPQYDPYANGFDRTGGDDTSSSYEAPERGGYGSDGFGDFGI